MIEVELQEYMGSDLSVCNAAWTSTYNKDRREEKYDDPKKIKELIFRMAKEGHSTPFESVVFRFWIKMPIFTDRQHVTHRIMSHNGLSGRYRTLPEEFFPVPDDVLKILNKMEYGFGSNAVGYYNSLMNQQQQFYRDVLTACATAKREAVISDSEYKRVREIARGVIGTASMVERTTIMNLRSFANYQRLRNSDHAQAEIRTVAQLMLEHVVSKNICPYSVDALISVGWRI